jgi:hypothetical protein
MKQTITQKYKDSFNPKNDLATMPEAYYGKFYNACTEPCDMLQGPCACGAWHRQGEWPDQIQMEVFGSIKDSSIKRKITIK